MERDFGRDEKRRGQGGASSSRDTGEEKSPTRPTAPRSEGASFASSTVSQRPPGLPTAREFLSRTTSSNTSSKAKKSSLRPIVEALGAYEERKSRQNLDAVASAIGNLKSGKRKKYGSVLDPLEHAVAYHQSRVYHGTNDISIEGNENKANVKDEDRVPGIKKTGLQTSWSGTGASRLDPLYSNQSKGKIHVGLSRNISKDYGTVIRPVLEKGRSVLNPEPPLAKNYVDYEPVPAEQKPQLTRDPHHRGGGATTETDISPNQVIFGTNTQLLNPTSPAEQQRKAGVLRAIGSNYGNDDLDDLDERHRQALEEGYISD